MIVLRFGLVHGYVRLVGLVFWIGLRFRDSHIQNTRLGLELENRRWDERVGIGIGRRLYC